MTRSKNRMPRAGTYFPGGAKNKHIPAGNNTNITISNTFYNTKAPAGNGQSFPARRYQQTNLRRSGIRLLSDYPIHLHSSTKWQDSKSETGSKQRFQDNHFPALFQAWQATITSLVNMQVCGNLGFLAIILGLVVLQ